MTTATPRGRRIKVRCPHCRQVDDHSLETLSGGQVLCRRKPCARLFSGPFTTYEVHLNEQVTNPRDPDERQQAWAFCGDTETASGSGRHSQVYASSETTCIRCLYQHDVVMAQLGSLS